MTSTSPSFGPRSTISSSPTNSDSSNQNGSATSSISTRNTSLSSSSTPVSPSAVIEIGDAEPEVVQNGGGADVDTGVSFPLKPQQQQNSGKEDFTDFFYFSQSPFLIGSEPFLKISILKQVVKRSWIVPKI